jgi:hypothetical protein
MDQLNARLEARPFKNTLVSLIPTKGFREFYEGKGFVALKHHSKKSKGLRAPTY